jgi:hypothetical protein
MSYKNSMIDFFNENADKSMFCHIGVSSLHRYSGFYDANEAQ